jgi:uncharacterized C2H2 Zn-finger protein
MKCPHCEYQDHAIDDNGKSVEGDKGEFYIMPVKMKRPPAWDDEEEELRACPKCGKTFIWVSDY